MSMQWNGNIRDGLAPIKTLKEFPYPVLNENAPIEFCSLHRREYRNESNSRHLDCPECRAEASRVKDAVSAVKNRGSAAQKPQDAKEQGYGGTVLFLAIVAAVSGFAGMFVEYFFHILR